MSVASQRPLAADASSLCRVMGMGKRNLGKNCGPQVHITQSWGIFAVNESSNW